MTNPYINSEFFSRLEAQELHLRNNLSGFFGGKHQTNKYGQTVEFADYREYMLGDDIRRIDWNLYSRFEKHYIKLFTDERQMHVQIFLDCSASMGKDNVKKGNYATCLAAGLGFLAVHNMDKLSIKLIQGKSVINPDKIIVGKTEFYRAVSQLQNITFDGDSFISDAILSNVKSTGKDGLTVIISDFLTDNDWKKAVDFLTFQGKQVLLVQVLDKIEINPNYNGRLNLIDSESLGMEDSKNMRMNITNSRIKAYNDALDHIVDEIKSFCSSRNVGFAQINTTMPIDKAIFEQLLKVGILE